ncbi:MAG TPA: hypothetical protein VI197_29530, partial [Polyangiaceae bacterium]
AASRPDAPVGDESPVAAGEDTAFRPKEASDEELTVVRPNPLAAQERAAYRDSQVEIARPSPSAAPSVPTAAPAALDTSPVEAAREAASVSPTPASTSTPGAAPRATKKASPPRRSPAAPRAKYLEPTAPPRADRRGTVDGSLGPTVAVVQAGDDVDAENADVPQRKLSTVASGAPTIITHRAPPPPPPPRTSALWSLAATLVAVAGVVTGVVWFVQKNQATTATDATAGTVEAKLQAARTATLAAPLPSAVPGNAVPGNAVPGDAVPGSAVPGSAVPGDAVPGDAVPGVPVSAPQVPAPEANAKAESVELEALPVLPSLQVDPARVRLEQAREATKRELAAQESPEALVPKAAPARAPAPAPVPVR